MLDSIYIGLTGLSSFSKGLSNISNNVANMNTPGFKRSTLSFEDLLYQRDTPGDGTLEQGRPSEGNGVAIGNSTIVYTQGDFTSTSNDLDAAINGNGFFVFRNAGQTYYSRGGQFELDSSGTLVSRNNQAHVAGLDSAGSLVDISTQSRKTSPAKPTTTVNLTGNLNKADLAASPYTLSTINVIGEDGGTHTLSAIFTNTGASAVPVTRTWTVSIQEGSTVLSQTTISFNDDGSLKSDSESYSFDYTPSGGQTQRLKFVFGQAGILTHGLTNYSGVTTTPTVESTDGYAYGALTKVTLDASGNVVAQYSNGQTANIAQLALAWFSYPGALTQDGGNFSVNDTAARPIYGAAGSGVFGTIKGGYIEASNADLTQQFSELIIIQRGYQGASQVVTTANEMIQQLMNIKGQK